MITPFTTAARIGAVALTSLAAFAVVTTPAEAVEMPAAATTAIPMTAIHCGHLLDVSTGKMLGETTIVTEGKRVREVTPGSQTPSGAATIDLSTQT